MCGRRRGGGAGTVSLGRWHHVHFGLHRRAALLLSASPAPLALADIEARFSARGRWRDRLPTILGTLEALGRARRPSPAAQRW